MESQKVNSMKKSLFVGQIDLWMAVAAFCELIVVMLINGVAVCCCGANGLALYSFFLMI